MLQPLQQLTGNNYFFYYGTYIFNAVGLDDSFQTSIVLGVVNFASTFVGIYAIERLGKRLCLLAGDVAMAVCFLIYSVLGTAGDVHIKSQGDAQFSLPLSSFSPSRQLGQVVCTQLFRKFTH